MRKMRTPIEDKLLILQTPVHPDYNSLILLANFYAANANAAKGAARRFCGRGGVDNLLGLRSCGGNKRTRSDPLQTDFALRLPSLCP
jgi:hypothetical protein